MVTDIQAKIDTYPTHAKKKFLALRALVYLAAKELNINKVEETLKWGEPSYLTKTGSTIRIDWKASTPDKIYIFFNCKSVLIQTLKELYPDQLSLEGNRAVVMKIDNMPNDAIIKHCFSMALNYHKIKHLPLLGN